VLNALPLKQTFFKMHQDAVALGGSIQI
jgi:hypothetical protein